MALLTKLLDVLTGGRPRTGRRRPASGTATAARRRDGAIEFAYEPRHDGDADPGEVVWAWVPFEEDPRQGKDRPVAVVGYWGQDLCGVPLTSKQHPGDPDQVPVGSGGWDPRRRPSYARLDKVMRLRPADVRREGSALDRRRYTELVDALKARQARR